MAVLLPLKILLGISGGIAAYKSAELVRLLKQAGAQVQVVMTPAAQAFITPLTLQALSGQPVFTELLDPTAEAAMGHIQLARWADAIVIAPASADLLARLATGQANDLLSTLCLASTAPLWLAPAMNQAMWQHPATTANVALLHSRGAQLLGPASGEQACGDTGPGRMLEPMHILAALQEAANAQAALPQWQGKTVVITAGPTREALDPVRYISNHSSGKMGYALAAACAQAGARTLLVSGPCSLATPKGVERLDVTSAQQMLNTCLEAAKNCDVFIGAAAVADYRPAQCHQQKMKKTANSEEFVLKLIKNPDILAEIAQLQPRPFMVGFAAETEQLIAHAEHKLRTKKVDLIIANDVSNPEIGFNSDHNAVTLVEASGNTPLPLSNKTQLANRLVAHIAARLPA